MEQARCTESRNAAPAGPTPPEGKVTAHKDESMMAGKITI
jgi:hypothetical protein